MFNFLELEPESFGLDISDLSLKIARLKKKGGFFRLASWGETKMKKGIIENGEIKDQPALIRQVEKFISKIKGEALDTKNVIASLPEKKAFFEIIKMPKMDLSELEQSVIFEAENHIPLPIEKAYIDFQLISENKKLNHFNILIAAVPKNVVDSYFFCLKRAGLKVQALEVESQSIVRSVIKNKPVKEPVLIIDFGESVTSFIVFSGFSLELTSSISINSQNLTEKIAQDLKISQEEAENLKIKYGLKKTKSKEDKNVLKSITPILENLIKEIKKYSDYYQTHNKKEIKKIILCGRGSNLLGLPELFSSKLKMPVEIANPWANILPEPLREVPGLSYKESLGYTTALGLALRGIKKL